MTHRVRDADRSLGFGRSIEWQRLRVGVIGLGIAGSACADALLDRGAQVVVRDAADGEEPSRRGRILRAAGADVKLGSVELPAELDLLIVSPGVRPGADVIQAARAADVAIWGELELAWRLREPGAAPWLCVTGTNGKTTTTLMLASILASAGKTTAAVGNIGSSLVAAVTDAVPYDVLAVEVGAPQLPFVHSIAPLAVACLNLAGDHIDHFGSFEAYRAAKGRIFERVERARVVNADDPETLRLLSGPELGADMAMAHANPQTVAFTLGVPAGSMLGIADGMLIDRAFDVGRDGQGCELAAVADVHPAAPHNVANALAAAALARAYGVSAAAVRAGLRAYEPAGHRIARVATVAGVDYVDDSKATNGHAALTSLQAYESVVWVAGGLAKGQRFEDVVCAVRSRLRGAVLVGADRELIAEALARHAPQVPVMQVAATDTGAMKAVVDEAARLARPGDTVLLAPGCASWDMFTSYSQRGDAFAEAVKALADAASQG